MAADISRIDDVKKLPATFSAEPSNAARVNNDNDRVKSLEDPFLAAAKSRKWKFSGKKRYLKQLYQQIDHKTIDKARLAPRPTDPAGYMTLVDMLRDSWAGVIKGELQGIVDKFCD
jgi:hypothetical protein